MNSVELLYKCEQLEGLKNEISNLIFEEIKEYCKYTFRHCPKKEEILHISIIDSSLNIIYDWEGDYYEESIPLRWFTDKESMLKEFKKAEKIMIKDHIDSLIKDIAFSKEQIRKNESEINKLEKELNNE